MQEFRFYSKACVMDGIVLNFLMDLGYDLILFPQPQMGAFPQSYAEKVVAYALGGEFLREFCA